MLSYPIPKVISKHHTGPHTRRGVESAVEGENLIYTLVCVINNYIGNESK